MPEALPQLGTTQGPMDGGENEAKRWLWALEVAESTALLPSHTALEHSAHLLWRQSGVAMEIGPLSPALLHPCLLRPSQTGLGGRT